MGHFRTTFIFLIISLAVEPALGQTGWYLINTGSSLNLNSVYFMDLNNGIIGADSGKILITTNSGTNWVQRSTITTEPILCVFMRNTAAYIVGTNTRILRTTNNGLNWDSIGIGGRKLSFINTSTGYSVTGYKTTNGGANWVYNGMVITLNVVHTVFFLNENTGFAGATNWIMSFNVYNTFISKSTSGGVNWFQVYSGPVEAAYPSLYDIFFSNNNYGYALEYSTINSTCKLLRTSNNGENWSAIQLPYRMNSVKFVGINSGWMCGINGNILHSTNGGSNWTNQQSPVFFDLTQIFMYDQYTGWITGSSGKILKTTNGGIIGLVPISEKIPNSFSLWQNYPNPFNPATIINYELPITNYVKLTVYDILGREISDLVNEKQTAGRYEVEFDGTNYPSGVYFYKLITADYTETRRMVLLK